MEYVLHFYVSVVQLLRSGVKKRLKI